MIIQEPIKAAINFSLDNFSYESAIFLAERLHAEVDSDESFYYLALAYFRSGKANVTYAFFQRHRHERCTEPRCIYLYSHCCYELDKADEALSIIASVIEQKPLELVTSFRLVEVFGELASFAALLYAKILQKLDYPVKAFHYYEKALMLNPLLWEAYERLAHIDPRKVNCDDLFEKKNFDIKQSCGTNPLINLLNKLDNDGSERHEMLLPPASEQSENLVHPNQAQVVVMGHCQTQQQQQQQQHFMTPQQNQQQQKQQPQQPPWKKLSLATPYAMIKQTSDKVDIITPEINGDWKTTACYAPTKTGTVVGAGGGVTATPRNLRKASSDALKSVNKNDVRLTNTISPTVVTLAAFAFAQPQQPPVENEVAAARRLTFGVIQLDEEALDSATIMDKIAVGKMATNMRPSTQLKRHNTRRTTQEVSNCEQVAVAAGVLRRSSRLYSSPHNCNVKENTTTGGAYKSKANCRTGATKRSRKTINFDSKTNEENVAGGKFSGITEEKPSGGQGAEKAMLKVDVNKAGMKIQLQSAHGMIELMKHIAQGYKYLCEFEVKKAVLKFSQLPLSHYQTGFIYGCLGKAKFELAAYDEAIELYKICHQLEPYRLQGMEYYSSALWHQQREIELSCLAQELVEFDKKSPQTWCVSGNCFSLQKEHETSIKFLRRAIQVDPNFSYAYTLLGHELVAVDEFENAMACFRNATRIDRRHYNAWYGMGMIYYKQEKYKQAENQYSRAYEIAFENPILMCHLAIVLNLNKKTDRAIALLSHAAKIDPLNALAKFHLSSIYFSLKEYDNALEQLQQLKQIAPKESMVYFLTGKICKERGHTQKALENFSWAMDLDPKGATNQIKELLDRQHVPVSDGIVVHNATTSDTTIGSTSTAFTSQASIPPPSGLSSTSSVSTSAATLVSATVVTSQSLSRDLRLEAEASSQNLSGGALPSTVESFRDLLEGSSQNLPGVIPSTSEGIRNLLVTATREAAAVAAANAMDGFPRLNALIHSEFPTLAPTLVPSAPAPPNRASTSNEVHENQSFSYDSTASSLQIDMLDNSGGGDGALRPVPDQGHSGDGADSDSGDDPTDPRNNVVELSEFISRRISPPSGFGSLSNHRISANSVTMIRPTIMRNTEVIRRRRPSGSASSSSVATTTSSTPNINSNVTTPTTTTTIITSSESRAAHFRPRFANSSGTVDNGTSHDATFNSLQSESFHLMDEGSDDVPPSPARGAATVMINDSPDVADSSLFSEDMDYQLNETE